MHGLLLFRIMVLITFPQNQSHFIVQAYYSARPRQTCAKADRGRAQPLWLRGH
jgi:hypothetical protein